MDNEDNKTLEIIKLITGTILFALSEIFSKATVSEFFVYSLYSAAYLVLGFEVLKNCFNNIKKKEFFDENLLMVIATFGAAYIGKYSEAVIVMLFYSIGEFLQDLATDKSKDRIKELMSIAPKKARVITENGYEEIDVNLVKEDWILEIRAGEKVSIDGIIIKGSAYFDSSAITGESIPILKKEGDTVPSGFIVTDSVIEIRTICQYKDSTVAKILKLVENNKKNKAPVEKFITSFAKVYTPCVLALAVLMTIIPSIITKQWTEWLYKSLCFLVISCPCALVISVPLTFFAGLGSCAKKGILVKGSNHLQTLAQADSFLFDKTGTLTKAKMAVTEFNLTNTEAIDAVFTVENLSSHPVAKAISNYIEYNYEAKVIEVSDFVEIRGKGITAKVNNKEIKCGNSNLISSDIKIPSDKTAVLVEYDNKFCGYILLEDEIKDSAKPMFDQLHKLGKETFMLTGDNAEVAKEVCNKTGCSKYFANLLPQDKDKKLKEMQKAGHKCVFTGDGINDAPVLISADTSIAMGQIGSQSAVEAAGIVIMNDNLLKIPMAVKAAIKTISVAKQNLIFAVAAKILCMLLVVFGQASMTVAVIADTPVTLVCILNSLRALR